MSDRMPSMKRVEADGEWTLMFPNETPVLAEVWVKELEELYEGYRREGHAVADTILEARV